MLVVSCVERGVYRLQEMTWHIIHVWGCRVANIPYQELFRFISVPSCRESYGDIYLPLIYGAQVPSRISTIVIVPLVCEELGYLGLPGQMRRYGSHHGGFTSEVVETLAHVGY